jgi:membrane protein implicated in regulation of membrane protease activity
MVILNTIGILAMFVIGLIVGTLVIGLANLLGIAGWIVGFIFAILTLAVIFVNDKLLDFEMKHIMRLIGRIGRLDTKEMEVGEGSQKQRHRMDYYGFLAGSIVGMGASLLWTPSFILDIIPF